MQISFDEYMIRSYKTSDKDSLVKYANNYNIARYLRNTFPNPYTKEDADRWINFVINQNPELNFAIATGDEIFGGIGIIPQNDIYMYSAEIGYWLAEPFWGKGIATKALITMTKFIFNKFSFVRLYAGVFEGNESSKKVLEKAGYKYEGLLRKAVYKEDKFLNQNMYAILKDELVK